MNIYISVGQINSAKSPKSQNNIFTELGSFRSNVVPLFTSAAALLRS